MLTRPIVILALVLATGPVLAQPGPFIAADLRYAAAVCTDTAFSPPVVEPFEGEIVDLTPLNYGCLLNGERNGIWMNFSIAASGRIGFAVTPTAVTDYDIAVWGPFTERVDTLLTDPIRCSWSSLGQATGANMVALDNAEGAGGDGWVRALDVVAGQHYVLYATNYSISGIGFDLTWEFQDGAALECLERPTIAFQQSQSTIQPGGSLSFTDQSTDSPYAWWWEFDSGMPATSLERDPQDITYELPGCYDVMLTAYNAAGDNALVTTCQVLVETTTGTSVHSSLDFTLVLVDGTLRISPAMAGSYTARMVDGTGRLVRNRSAQGPLELSLADLPTGVYSVVVDHGSGRMVQRMVLGQ